MYHLKKRGGSFEMKKKKKKAKNMNPVIQTCSRRFVFAPQDISSSIHFRTSSRFLFSFCFPQDLPGKPFFCQARKKKTTITPIIIRVTSSSAVKE